MIKDRKIVWVKPSELIANPNNPRKADANKIKKLAKKIEADPDFLTLRPILVNVAKDGEYAGQKMIYAGEQRFKATSTVLKWKEIPIIVDEALPDDVMTKRMIEDNRHEGTWLQDILEKIVTPEIHSALSLDDIIVVKDNYELELGKHTNDNAEYPIVPKYSEKYMCVMVFAENELDENWLKNIFKLDKRKDYKNSHLGETHVVYATRFQEILDSDD